MEGDERRDSPGTRPTATPPEHHPDLPGAAGLPPEASWTAREIRPEGPVVPGRYWRRLADGRIADIREGIHLHQLTGQDSFGAPRPGVSCWP